MTPADPQAARARFRQVVARGLERADRERREHLARLAPKRRTAAEVRRAQTPRIRSRQEDA